MTLLRSRLYHTPALARILWAFQREAAWLPRVRSRRNDLGMMASIIRRGWVQHLRDRRGVAAFIARDGETIHALYVHPRARRRGAARALLNDAKRQVTRLELWTPQANTDAQAFYHTQGFTAVAQTNGQGSDENLPEIKFVWEREATYG